MARYLGPKCKLARREGKDLFNKSSLRGLETKCKVDVAPGQHGAKRSRITDFGTQLRAKQRLKRTYGLLEKQFRKYYLMAAKSKGATGEVILQYLESRLDNVVYRLGFASTRAEARQLVSHKSVLVDGSIVNIASFQVKPGQTVSIKQKSQKQTRISLALELSKTRENPAWIKNEDNFSGSLVKLPKLEELPSDYNVQLVVELYSK